MLWYLLHWATLTQIYKDTLFLVHKYTVRHILLEPYYSMIQFIDKAIFVWRRASNGGRKAEENVSKYWILLIMIISYLSNAMCMLIYSLLYNITIYSHMSNRQRKAGPCASNQIGSLLTSNPRWYHVLILYSLSDGVLSWWRYSYHNKNCTGSTKLYVSSLCSYSYLCLVLVYINELVLFDAEHFTCFQYTGSAVGTKFILSLSVHHLINYLHYLHFWISVISYYKIYVYWFLLYKRKMFSLLYIEMFGG